MYEKLRLLRNHGLTTRDEVEILGYNSRLDSVQAAVGLWLIDSTHAITDARIANGAYYDAAFATIPGVTVPPRRPDSKRVFHLYMVFSDNRDALYAHLPRTRHFGEDPLSDSDLSVRRRWPISAIAKATFR